MQQVVRLDQYPKLAPALESNPIFAMQMYFTVLTNPTPMGAGVGPGPAGNRVNIRKVIERSGMAIGNPKTQQTMMMTLSSGEPDAKMRMISAMAQLASIFSNEQQQEQMKELAKKLLESVDDTRGDTNPSVRGWAMFRSALIRSDEHRKQGAVQMIADPNWTIRALGVLVAGMLPAEQAAQTLEAVKADAEPIVALLAKSTIEVAKHPPATQPTTAPTTQPAADPFPGFNLGK